MAWVNLPGVIVLYFYTDVPSILFIEGKKILRFTFILECSSKHVVLNIKVSVYTTLAGTCYLNKI